MSSNKRRRTGSVVVQTRQVRPIDKSLITVSQTATTSVTATTLKTTTFPCTIVGLRWDLSFLSLLTTGNSIVLWFIVVVKDGNSANTPSFTNGADAYTPEQNVLAFGTSRVRDSDVGSGPSIIHNIGSTKTMRKLKAGDLLQFITLSDVASSQLAIGMVQFFCKS